FMVCIAVATQEKVLSCEAILPISSLIPIQVIRKAGRAGTILLLPLRRMMPTRFTWAASMCGEATTVELTGPFYRIGFTPLPLATPMRIFTRLKPTVIKFIVVATEEFL